MLQLQEEDLYCAKLIRAMEQCVEAYNRHCPKHPIIIKDKPLKYHAVLAKVHSSEYRIAVLDSMNNEDKLKNLVYVFSCNNYLMRIFYCSGNKHIWDAVMQYLLFGECKAGEFQIELQKLEKKIKEK